MNNFQRKNRKQKRGLVINPWIIIGVTAFIALWFIVLAYNTYGQIQNQKAEIAKVEKRNVTLRKQLANIKPKKNAVTAGKFDVQKNYKELDKTYLTLLKFAFGTAKSPNQLSKYDDLYTQYFGTNGYKRLKQLAFADSKALVTQNINTGVAFNGFDGNALTTNVVAYVSINTKNGKELIYMNCTYDFKHKLADSANFQLKSLDDD